MYRNSRKQSTTKKDKKYVPFLLLVSRSLVVGRDKGGVLVEGGAAEGAVEDADGDQHEAGTHLHQLGLVGLLGVAGDRGGVGLVDDLIVADP